MSEINAFDTNLVHIILADAHREDAQKKINRHMKQFLLVRVVLPVVIVVGVSYAYGRLNHESND